MHLSWRRKGGLTSAQRKFARDNDAIPGMAAMQDPRMIFMYREEAERISRWLVDENGHAVDLVVFRRQDGHEPAA